MCFDFNSASGCVEGQKAGFVPGSHCQKNGKKFITICSDYEIIDVLWIEQTFSQVLHLHILHARGGIQSGFS